MAENTRQEVPDLLAALQASVQRRSQAAQESRARLDKLVDPEIIDAEIVSDQCELGYRGCTGTGTLVEDPYEADVNNTPDQMIVACDNCLQELCDDI